jgi:ureidoglycolate lyase
MTIVNIVPQDLTDLAFKPFGQIVRMTSETHLPGGHYWDTWVTWPRIDPPLDSFGTVVARRPESPIVLMEAHTCQELLAPITGAIVQPLALGADMNDPDAGPPLDSIVAFVIKPGEAILIDAGIWHAPALPYDQSETTYQFVFPRQTLSPGPTPHRMIPFSDGHGFSVSLPVLS